MAVPTPTPEEVVKNFGKSVAPLLQPGEELLAAVHVRRASAVNKFMIACMEVTGPGPELPKKSAVAVTSQRVLVLGVHGIGGPADQVLWDAPIAQVQSVEQRMR